MQSTPWLIISSGDISDVDGFMALAEYARIGADVIFVMNYPAYINKNMRFDDELFEETFPGFGFMFKALFEFEKEDSATHEGYRAFMSQRQGETSFDRMKSAMTDLAFQFARRVWNEVESRSEEPPRGKLFFYVGGENAVNPFSKTAVKDEVLLYSDFLTDGVVGKTESSDGLDRFCCLTPDEGMLYDESGKLCQGSSGETGDGESFSFSNYESIFMDFNGSMAFFHDDVWLVRELQRPEIVTKVAGVFIMGGVVADAPPQTMPCIKGILNRFSCATMNQLYHPARTARFLDFVGQHKIPAFIVTNNVVQDLTTWADEARQCKTYQGMENFLRANGLMGPFLARIARAYYESPHKPPRKPFDYYTAAALRAHVQGKTLQAEAGRLFYSGSKGVALVSGPEASWEEARDAYRGVIDHPPAEGDSDFVRAKKASFARERGELAALGALPHVVVGRLGFELCRESGRLEVAASPTGGAGADGK